MSALIQSTSGYFEENACWCW